MKAKMGELKRASLRRKMLEIVKIQQLDVDDLWPNSDFETGFGEAATVRNDLFHNLKIKSNREMQTNLIRLRYLVERMILSSLGWDKSNRWINNDQDLKFANL